jgi:hypothetical protein
MKQPIERDSDSRHISEILFLVISDRNFTNPEAFVTMIGSTLAPIEGI